MKFIPVKINRSLSKIEENILRFIFHSLDEEFFNNKNNKKRKLAKRVKETTFYILNDDFVRGNKNDKYKVGLFFPNDIQKEIQNSTQLATSRVLTEFNSLKVLTSEFPKEFIEK